MQVSPRTRELLSDIHAMVLRATEDTVRSLGSGDTTLAANVVNLKPLINRLFDDAAEHQARRLTADEPNRIATYASEVDVMEQLRRIYYFAKRIAKALSNA